MVLGPPPPNWNCITSFSAMQFLFAPVWGSLSDRIGRRPVIMFGLAGSIVFYTLFGLATVWQSLGLLFVARVAPGFAAPRFQPRRPTSPIRPRSPTGPAAWH